MTKSMTEKPMDMFGFPITYDTCRLQVRSDDINTLKSLMELLLVCVFNELIKVQS